MTRRNCSKDKIESFQLEILLNRFFLKKEVIYEHHQNFNEENCALK